MTGLPWTKLHVDILGDPKLMRAARKGAAGLGWTPWLFAFAARAGDAGRLTVAGEPAEPEDIAPLLPGATPADVAACLASLEALAVLVRDDDGALRFAKWETRAGRKPSDAPDAVKSRVQRHRDTRRKGSARVVTPAPVEGVTPGNALQGVTCNALGNATEVEVEEEKEGEREQQQQHDASNGDASSGASSAAAIAVRVERMERTTAVRPAPSPSRASRQPFAYPPDFEACWAAYPPRASGDNPKRKAYDQWAARRADGVPAETLLAGTARYAAYCAAAYGGPEDRVMHGATFYGRDRRFESAWTPPAATTAPAGGSGAAASAASEADALFVRLESHGLLTFGGNRDAYEAAIVAATPDGTEPAAFRALVRGVSAWTLAAEGDRRFAVRELGKRLAAYRGAAPTPAGGTGTMRPQLAAAMGGAR